MSVSSLQLWCFNTCTVDSLSDLVMMCFPLQSRPHPTHEAMIGIISFTAIIDNNAAMDWESSTVLWLCHIWSQRLSQKAPQPHDPEASKVTIYSGLLLMRVGIIDIAFH